MNINLSKRYPNSRTEDITEAFEHGFEVGYKMGYDDGYDDGYHQACEIWQAECQQVRAALRALLDATIDKGEAPAHEVTD